MYVCVCVCVCIDLHVGIEIEQENSCRNIDGPKKNGIWYCNIDNLNPSQNQQVL